MSTPFGRLWYLPGTWVEIDIEPPPANVVLWVIRFVFRMIVVLGAFSVFPVSWAVLVIRQGLRVARKYIEVIKYIEEKTQAPGSGRV